MVVPIVSVCAGFRLERGLLNLDFEAQPLDHVIQYMVVRILEPVFRDLNGRMAVSQVITGAGHEQGIVADNRGNRFSRRPDPHDQAIFGQ